MSAGFLQLFLQVALSIAMELRFIPVNAESIGNICFVEIVIG